MRIMWRAQIAWQAYAFWTGVSFVWCLIDGYVQARRERFGNNPTLLRCLIEECFRPKKAWVPPADKSSMHVIEELLRSRGKSIGIAPLSVDKSGSGPGNELKRIAPPAQRLLALPAPDKHVR
jgi:hypothetical protein